MGGEGHPLNNHILPELIQKIPFLFLLAEFNPPAVRVKVISGVLTYSPAAQYLHATVIWPQVGMIGIQTVRPSAQQPGECFLKHQNRCLVIPQFPLPLYILPDCLEKPH